MLEVSGLRVGLGEGHPVQEVSFSLAAGERLGIIGQSGSGKSSIARALTGLLPSHALITGTVTFNGAPLPTDDAGFAALRRGDITILPQGDPQVFDPAQVLGDILPDAAALEAVGLVPNLRRSAGSLSPAERQLLMIALALHRAPKLLIADEPFVPLDILAQRRVIDLMRHTSETKGMAILLISHDFKAVAALSTNVLILGDGKLVESGPVAEIFARPTQDYSKLLIAGGRARARTLMRSPIGTDLVEVRNLGLAYPHPAHRLTKPRPPITALDSVSFTIRRGEALAIVGPAQSGKSSLTRLIAGLDRASSGNIVYEHQPYRGRDLPRPHRHEIGFTFDDPRRSFAPRATLGASVAEPLRLESHLIIEEQADRLMEVVRAVGLSAEHLALYPADVTLGDLQRLAIARALITRPRLVIFDEPARVLDASQRGDLLMLINRLRADFGFTALLTANDFDLIRNVADRVLVIENGRIVEDGTPGALIDAPTHPLTKALINARLPEVGIGVVAPVGL